MLTSGVKTEHRMQLICDGEESKHDVLEASLTQYREVFIKAKRDFEILYNASSPLARRVGSETDIISSAERRAKSWWTRDCSRGCRTKATTAWWPQKRRQQRR